MSSLFKVLHEMLLEALGNLHHVMWIWETLDPQGVWRDSLICGKKKIIMIWYIMLLKGSFVILKWRSQNFMKSQNIQKTKESIETKYVQVFPWWHHVGRVPSIFLCMSTSSSQENSFPIPTMRLRWSTERSSTLSQPFEHVNVAPTLHMLSSSLRLAALHWLRSMNYSSSPPSPCAPFSSVVTELCYMVFAPSSDFCNMWWETVWKRFESGVEPLLCKDFSFFLLSEQKTK